MRHSTITYNFKLNNEGNKLKLESMNYIFV